MHVDKKYY